MPKNLNIGFDLDKIFIDTPPFIPDFIINLFYKKRDRGLVYRMPGRIEKQIRILSHLPIFRPAIQNNILSLKKISKLNQDIYLISGRFSFLKNRTENWIKRRGIDTDFKKMYFNYKDQQPHLFKDELIKKLKIEKFVDDDLDLLIYLAKENPNVNFFWLSSSSSKINLPSNIKRVKHLDDFFLNYV